MAGQQQMPPRPVLGVPPKPVPPPTGVLAVTKQMEEMKLKESISAERNAADLRADIPITEPPTKAESNYVPAVMQQSVGPVAAVPTIVASEPLVPSDEKGSGESVSSLTSVPEHLVPSDQKSIDAAPSTMHPCRDDAPLRESDNYVCLFVPKTMFAKHSKQAILAAVTAGTYPNQRVTKLSTFLGLDARGFFVDEDEMKIRYCIVRLWLPFADAAGHLIAEIKRKTLKIVCEEKGYFLPLHYHYH